MPFQTHSWCTKLFRDCQKYAVTGTKVNTALLLHVNTAHSPLPRPQTLRSPRPLHSYWLPFHSLWRCCCMFVSSWLIARQALLPKKCPQNASNRSADVSVLFKSNASAWKPNSDGNNLKEQAPWLFRAVWEEALGGVANSTERQQTSFVPST